MTHLLLRSILFYIYHHRFQFQCRSYRYSYYNSRYLRVMSDDCYCYDESCIGHSIAILFIIAIAIPHTNVSLSVLFRIVQSRKIDLRSLFVDHRFIDVRHARLSCVTASVLCALSVPLYCFEPRVTRDEPSMWEVYRVKDSYRGYFYKEGLFFYFVGFRVN